jgi:TRAP-type C4-dicarboxylate transport system permease small subunit
MRAINKVIDFCINVMAGFAAVWLGFLLLSISYATFSRFVFHSPKSNLIEISAYGLLFITFLASPWLLRQHGHINVDLFLEMYTPKVRARVQQVNDLLGLATCLVICFFAAKLTISNYTSGIKVMDSMHTPQFLLLAAIPLGLFFLAVQFFRNFLNRRQKIDADANGGER